jgi:nucleoid-associated protein YejK
MKKDPMYGLFSEERGNELGDIIRKLWQGEEDFLKFQERKENKEKEVNQKYLGFIPKKIWGINI